MALEPLIYDETTGLPKLPDGFAWKVEVNEYLKYEDNPDENILTVQIASRIVEKLTWFGKLIGTEPCVDWITWDHEYSEAIEKCANDTDDLKSAATQLYNKLRDAELKRAQLEELVGLYPPKSIL